MFTGDPSLCFRFGCGHCIGLWLADEWHLSMLHSAVENAYKGSSSRLLCLRSQHSNSHTPISKSSRLHIFASSYLHIFTPSQLHSFTSSHPKQSQCVSPSSSQHSLPASSLRCQTLYPKATMGPAPGTTAVSVAPTAATAFVWVGLPRTLRRGRAALAPPPKRSPSQRYDLR